MTKRDKTAMMIFASVNIYTIFLLRLPEKNKGYLSQACDRNPFTSCYLETQDFFFQTSNFFSRLKEFRYYIWCM